MSTVSLSTRIAQRFHVRGIVQGVGFRPFVVRLATVHALTGWILNGSDGVEIHVEGEAGAVRAFENDLTATAPAAARIASVETTSAECAGFRDFEIRDSTVRDRPTVHIAPDLPVCDACLHELSAPGRRRFGYPYINCTECGPRYSIILELPYDRQRTTMSEWVMCEACRREYENADDRRFHAQPVACPACGPHYRLEGFTIRSAVKGPRSIGDCFDAEAIAEAARLLRSGRIVAVKGLGGYHLACDARNPTAVEALRARKFRKERPFAVMAKDMTVLRQLVRLSGNEEALAQSIARPIVLAPKRIEVEGVAPDNTHLGVMLPYTPVHHLLFAQGAPDALVMTSGNRSSEPIAYEDDDARSRLAGIADVMLVGDRQIARRVDDSVVQNTVFGPAIVRRSRGYAPAVVARLPGHEPILAVGADLKNSITLVVDGEAIVSQHIGDLEHYPALGAFDQTVHDLTRMYGLDEADLIVAHDAHPEYASTARAMALNGTRRVAVQHHRAHVASVLAERGALDTRVLGVAFDGTGFGDDGTIWGGELFIGSVVEGFTRVGHLREASLPGGDAAARFPAQAAAGFVADLDDLGDLTARPFSLPKRYRFARKMQATGVRVFRTTSVGRLFDAVAALLGFTRPATFEAQAAIWLEHLAEASSTQRAFHFPYADNELDYRPALAAVIEGRRKGQDPCDIARAWHRGLARGIAMAVRDLTASQPVEAIVLSGGVFQNALLLADLKPLFDLDRLPVWINREVPANDGGISLGQAALAACSRTGCSVA